MHHLFDFFLDVNSIQEAITILQSGDIQQYGLNENFIYGLLAHLSGQDEETIKYYQLLKMIMLLTGLSGGL